MRASKKREFIELCSQYEEVSNQFGGNISTNADIQYHMLLEIMHYPKKDKEFRIVSISKIAKSLLTINCETARLILETMRECGLIKLNFISDDEAKIIINESASISYITDDLNMKINLNDKIVKFNRVILKDFEQTGTRNGYLLNALTQLLERAGVDIDEDCDLEPQDHDLP